MTHNLSHNVGSFCYCVNSISGKAISEGDNVICVRLISYLDPIRKQLHVFHQIHFWAERFQFHTNIENMFAAPIDRVIIGQSIKQCRQIIERSIHMNLQLKQDACRENRLFIGRFHNEIIAVNEVMSLKIVFNAFHTILSKRPGKMCIYGWEYVTAYPQLSSMYVDCD